MLTNLVSKCVPGICSQILKTAGGDDNSSRKNLRKTLWRGGGGEGWLTKFTCTNDPRGGVGQGGSHARGLNKPDLNSGWETS